MYAPHAIRQIFILLLHMTLSGPPALLSARKPAPAPDIITTECEVLEFVDCPVGRCFMKAKELVLAATTADYLSIVASHLS
jgi:hypothetical protein